MLRSKWQNLPASIHSQHVFAIGDIHGHSIPLREALETISRIPSDDLPRHLVFLGDTIDRGPDNIGTARLVQNAAEIANVDIVTILPGNHEIMLSKGLQSPHDEMLPWTIFGGQQIIDELDPDRQISSYNELADLIKQELPSYLISALEDRPSHLFIDDVLFVHAGVSPQIDINEFLRLSYQDDIPGNLHWAWIRGPFLDWTGGWLTDRPITVVHGHSPAIETLYSHTSDIERLSMLAESHGRVNLDAGADDNISQVAMAEFLSGSYRVHIFQDEVFKAHM